MDRITLHLNKLSSAIDNFQVGAAVYEERSDYEALKRVEDAFKLRRSKALLETAYKDQNASIGSVEEFSSFELEKPRLLRREKVRNECQQVATQGMFAFAALQSRINSWKDTGDSVSEDPENGGHMRSKLYKFILELSNNSWGSFGEGYNELLSAEKSMFDEMLRFQEVFMELKKGKDNMSTTTANDTKIFDIADHYTTLNTHSLQKNYLFLVLTFIFATRLRS
ncbi:uncharacterized protein LOC124157830 isoform X2 [Ischnura elegans]|uniref:uncharacterized protein LOC124157830 isoform X2 n=1 Tax=Ischnura elegans TaxID=197161 RepID=UPI001ED8BDD1|nr:uncharacterized protein LOC124157830 isoform X2 [Ischnura elegans]